jgi:serine/threonine protein phosphatase PrpC
MDATLTFEIDAASLSDVGLCRTTNEDAVRLTRVAFDDGTRGLLAIVADGMGGHLAGDVASRLAVDTVEREVLRHGRFVSATLQQALIAANRTIFEAAERNTATRGMGTTCTAIAVRGGDVHCAYVGDSRVYLCRAGRAYTMTQDHSSVRELVAMGLLTPAQARCHAERNVLLRALGTTREVQVTAWESAFPLRGGDRLVVCTDGAFGGITDDEMAALIGRSRAHDACAALVALARQRGGEDNITAAVLAVEGARQ